MAKKSAGLIFYRIKNRSIEFLLIHPGGPFWSKKDLGAWSIPKGEIEENEEPLAAALREVEEEIGIIAEGNFIELTPVKQKSGKIIMAWAIEMDFEIKNVNSNTFEMEWPPNSGRKQNFPEVDKADWMTLNMASKKILPAQLPLLEELATILSHK